MPQEPLQPLVQVQHAVLEVAGEQGRVQMSITAEAYPPEELGEEGGVSQVLVQEVEGYLCDYPVLHLVQVRPDPCPIDSPHVPQHFGAGVRQVWEKWGKWLERSSTVLQRSKWICSDTSSESESVEGGGEPPAHSTPVQRGYFEQNAIARRWIEVW